MRGQKGFTVVELLVVLAIMGVITFIVAINVGPQLLDTDPSSDKAIYSELRNRPISSLNVTELQIVADYLASRYRDSEAAQRATIYQNQIIITKLDELLQTEVTP